jgi:glycine betaine transporter
MPKFGQKPKTDTRGAKQRKRQRKKKGKVLSVSGSSEWENNKQYLDHLARERIEEEVDQFETDLRKSLRRADDQAVISHQKASFRNKLLLRELRKESLSLEEIREEEHKLINTTLVFSLGFLAIFVLLALWNAGKIEILAAEVKSFCVANLSWFYLLASSGFLFVLAYLAFSRFGSVVLGDPSKEPEFSNLSWIAMLFSAGMGVGLLFWGGAEPLIHYTQPPIGVPRSPEAGSMAMVYTTLHWGFHGWGIYTICAVAVAYFGFRKRKKYLISSCIIELFDNLQAQYYVKAFADITSTLAVVFGLAASLGMGVLQLSSGLREVYGIELGGSFGLTLILVTITVLYLVSAGTGLKRGIKILSNVNVGVALFLMLFVFLAGPKLFTLKLFVDTIGRYLNELFVLSFQTNPMIDSYEKWMGDWTITYFTWWIAWAPFVGIFLARISRGRTIRELIVGSLVLPTMFTILWFAIFGGAALYLDMGGFHALATAVNSDVTTALFLLLKQFPFFMFTGTISLALLLTFLVTSADSATYVIAMMTTEGDLDPSFRIKLVWGVTMAVVTLVLTLGGGIDAIKAAALTFAFPFTFVLILMVVSLLVRLGAEVENSRI